MTTIANTHLRTPTLPAPTEKGFTLVETMVASFVLAMGILAFLILQLQALNATHSAGIQTQAALLASDVVDSVRANLPGLLKGAYNRNTGKAADLVGSTPNCNPCTPEQIAALDVNTWLQRVADEITDSEVSLEFSQPDFTVSIQWIDSKDKARKFELTTQICAEETPQGGGTRCLQ